MSIQHEPGQPGAGLAALVLPHPNPQCLLSSPGPLSDGSTFHTPPIQPLASDVFQFSHNLNAEKQMAKILGNTETPSVTLEINDGGNSVNLKCNAGFFIKVAKPTFYGLSLGYSFVHPTTSFLVTEFTHQKDASGIDQSLKLRLSFTVQGVAAFITIHVYNSTQALLVQGTRIMPDSTTAAVWFTKNMLHDHFASKAALHQDEISAFHDALLHLGSNSSVSSAGKKKNQMPAKPRPDCVVCSAKITGNSKPVACPAGQCTGMMHKR